MARTNLSVDRGIFEDFAAQAGRRKKTLFAFTNESLSVISKMVAEGVDLNELYSAWRVLSILKQIEVIALPSDFLESIIGFFCETDKEQLFQAFRELGASVVGMLKVSTDDVASLPDLASDFRFVIPIKHLVLTAEGNGTVRVDVVGAGRRLETTQCSCEFLKSIMNGYGYRIVGEELHLGAISLWCEKKTSPGSSRSRSTS